MAFERNPRFYGELKQTNEDILKVVEGCHKKSPYFDFSVTFQDYIKQIDELKKKFPVESDQDVITKTVTTGANNFAGGLFANISTMNNSTNNSNSSNNISNSTTITNSIFTSLASGQTAPFFIPPPKNNDEQEQMNDGEEHDEDSAPPQPNVEKFEEPDAKYTARCKLYERLSGNPTLLGCGSLFVKQLDAPNKLHLIVRQDPDLRKVLLNHVITASTPLRTITKAIQMIVPGEDGKTNIYIIKVKDDKIASELHQILHSVRDAQ